MPKVPSRDSFDQVAGAGPSARFDSRTVGQDVSGVGQIATFGQQISSATQQLSKYALDARKEADEIRVNDAYSKARERALELAYNTDDGYTMLKGQNALERPDNVSLAQEYNQRFNESINELTDGLGNENQKQQFRSRAASLSDAFNQGLQRHTMTEFVNYHGSVADGAMKVSQQEAELFWDDPERVDAAINGIEDPQTGKKVGGLRQAVEQKARLTGMSDVELAAEIRNAESDLHTRVVQAALANENVKYANGYFTQKRKHMTGSDVLKVKKVLDDRMELEAARVAVSTATRESLPSFAPDDFTRLQTLLVGSQRDMTPETRVQETELLADMVRKYGDVSKATAAYYVKDPKTVDKAIKEAEAEGRPSQWLEKLPASVRNYVDANTNRYASGAGAPKMKTEAEFVKEALAKAPADLSAEGKSKVEELAKKQHKSIMDSIKQKSEQALDLAQRELVENGGSFAELSAGTRLELLRYDPAKYKEASAFAKAVRETGSTNDVAYARVMQDPLILANMSEPEFNQFLMTEFAPSDRSKIIDLRKETLSGTSTDSPTSINGTALNGLLDTKLKSIGVNPKPKDDNEDDWAKVGRIQKVVRARIFALQKATGRKMSPEELEREIDNMFVQSVELEGVIYGTNTVRIFDLDAGDIPNVDRLKIIDALKQQGNVDPTDDEILATYQIKALRGK